jgi:uncharacterized protein (DUF849 family)
MISEAFITSAVTGAGDTVGRSEHVPVTPEQIAESALDAARAGAAIVHIHVRMNFAAGGEYIMANTPGMLRAMALRVQELGVRPELEVFDTRHLVLVQELIEEGLIDDPPLIQLCMGIPYGAPADLGTLLAMVARLPSGAVYSAFAIGRLELPYAALAPLVGANVRVGLEDNLYLSRGQLATNAELVERAVRLLDGMDVRVMGPDAVREKLSLRARV